MALIDTTTKAAFGETLVAGKRIECGWKFEYNVNSDIVATATVGGGTVTNANSAAVLSTGAATSQSATVYTRRVLRYIPGIGGFAIFTAVFTAGVAGSKQIIGIGDSAHQDGFFFGYDGANFGILRRSGGVENWTYRSNWNGPSAMVNDLDPTKGNVYLIRYQWLGFGSITFQVRPPAAETFETVHTIKYPNQAVVVSTRNPTFPILAHVENTTNNTDIVLKTPSAIGGIEGEVEPPAINPFDLPRTVTATKATITTEAAVVSLRNQATYQSVTNRVQVRVAVVTVAAEGTKVVILRARVGATLGGVPSFDNYDANTSPMAVDTSATTATGGTVRWIEVIQKTESRTFSLNELNIQLAPGETVTFTAESANSTVVDYVVFWEDLF